MSDVIVLCYHAVSERWPSELAVFPERLERQLTRLIKRGYKGATFSAAVTTKPAQATVVVTFDDAYRSVSKLAAPILARLGVPGTVFVPTAYIGSEQPMCWPGIEEWRDGPWAEELLPMSETELRGLAEAGWEVGSHTHTHARLTEIDDAALRHELEQSRALCEQLLGRPCSSLAYPYGACDRRVMRAAATAGYRTAGALGRLEQPHALSWPRIYIARIDDDNRFRLKVNPAMRWLRGTRIGRAADAARYARG